MNIYDSCGLFVEVVDKVDLLSPTFCLSQRHIHIRMLLGDYLFRAVCRVNCQLAAGVAPVAQYLQPIPG